MVLPMPRLPLALFPQTHTFPNAPADSSAKNFAEGNVADAAQIDRCGRFHATGKFTAPGSGGSISKPTGKLIPPGIDKSSGLQRCGEIQASGHFGATGEVVSECATGLGYTCHHFEGIIHAGLSQGSPCGQTWARVRDTDGVERKIAVASPLSKSGSITCHSSSLLISRHRRNDLAKPARA